MTLFQLQLTNFIGFIDVAMFGKRKQLVNLMTVTLNSVEIILTHKLKNKLK